MKFAHIINPVNAPAGSVLAAVQPITFESLRVASDFARGKVDVKLYAVGYNEDRRVIPDYVEILPDLERSVLDFGNFSPKRKYPLLVDVLQAAYNAEEATHIIFSNMDIGLLPHFYPAVKSIVEKQQCDALLINRRGISIQYKSTDELPLMYADYGVPHPGFDCFVFERALFKKLILEQICVGVSFSEVALLHNFVAFARKLILEDKLHLTFHIGTEVMPPLLADYYKHNRNVYEQKIYPTLKPHLQLANFPYATLPFYKRMLKWALNPSFRTHQMAEMEGKNLLRKLKFRLDSWRFNLLDKL